jgi:hypothetical protein
MYSDQELADMRFVYGLAYGNAVVAHCLYQESYPGRKCPDRKAFVSIQRRLCEHWNVVPRVANRRRTRSTTSEMEEDIVDVVNETPAISARRSVVHSIVGAFQERQLYPYNLQCVQALSLQDYPARVMFCQWFLQ